MRTKQQLNQSIPGYSFLRCASDIYKTNGFSGFFRGISASLFGMTETVIFFLIYEELKKTVVRRQTDESLRNGFIFIFSTTYKQAKVPVGKVNHKFYKFNSEKLSFICSIINRPILLSEIFNTT